MSIAVFWILRKASGSLSPKRFMRTAFARSTSFRASPELHVFIAAVAGGALAWVTRQPLVLGYVLGGLLISPLTPGPSVSDSQSFELFAEVGVVLLMFSVGIEFSLRDLQRVRWVALVGALEFLEKLAALTPRPEINLALYDGVLAPHARWRPDVVAYRRAETDGVTDAGAAMGRTGAGRGAAARPRYWTWAALMRRGFDLDDPAVMQKILAHVGLPGARDGPRLPSATSVVQAVQPALPGVTP